MVESELTVVVSVEAGVAYTLSAVDASGSYFDNDGQTVLHVTNAGASPDNVTIVGQHACAYGVVHDRVVAVTNGTSKVIGPFDTVHFNDSSGHAHITHSYTTTVTNVAIRVPKVQ